MRSGDGREDHGRDDGGQRLSGHLTDEREHRQAAERVSGQQGDVVQGNRVEAQPAQGRDKECRKDERLGQRQRAARRIEDVGVEKRCRADGKNVGRPRKRPRIEQRVAEVVDAGADLPHLRVGDERGEPDEEDGKTPQA